MEEADLIRAAATGDREAFRALFERHRERVFRVAAGIVLDQEEARDVAQKVFLRLWERLPSYRTEYPFEVWLHRITVNAAIDSYRRRKARGLETGLDTAIPRPGLRTTNGPDREAIRKEVRQIFSRLAARLPLRQRLAFTLREIEGLTTEEVGAVLRATPSTIRNHILRARKTLQDALRREYPEYLPREAMPASTADQAPESEK